MLIISDPNLSIPKVVEFTMRNEIDRNTTKAEYKAIKHWLRTCKRIVNNG